MADPTPAESPAPAEQLPALAEVRRLELRPEPLAPAVTREQAQLAVVAATGLVAGAVAARVVGRRRRRRRGAGPLQVLSTRSFLVDVHLVERR